MAEMQEFELFSSATNAVIARHLGRNFPGILIQGDTMRGLLSDIEELCDELESGDIEAVEGIAEALQERFIDFLTHYEKVLRDHKMELPYVNPVSD